MVVEVQFVVVHIQLIIKNHLVNDMPANSTLLHVEIMLVIAMSLVANGTLIMTNMMYIIAIQQHIHAHQAGIITQDQVHQCNVTGQQRKDNKCRHRSTFFLNFTKL